MHLFCLSLCIISSWLICFWQVLDKFLPFLVLFVAGCALYVAIQSRRQARVAAQVNLFYQHMARYSSPEMGKALDIIRELFGTRNQDEVAFLRVVKKFHDKELYLSAMRPHKKAGEPLEVFRHDYEETDQARRQVSNFFTYSFDLFADFKVLDDVYFKKICRMESFKYSYHVIEWLELAFNPDYARKTWTDLLEQSGRKDIEYLKELRPPKTWAEVELMIKSKIQQQSE